MNLEAKKKKKNKKKNKRSNQTHATSTLQLTEEVEPASKDDSLGKGNEFLLIDSIIWNEIDWARKVWSDLHVPENTIRSLVEQNFLEPTPIQNLTLPAAIRDRLDIIGAAETVIFLPFLRLEDSLLT